MGAYTALPHTFIFGNEGLRLDKSWVGPVRFDVGGQA